MRRSAGFSLVELVVAAALGVTALAALGHVFTLTSQGQRHARASAEAQDSLRFAMAAIAHDLEMAGFFARVHDAGNLLSSTAAARTAYTGTCPADWLFDDRLPVDALDNPTSAQVKGRFPCVTGALDGRDVLAVKRVSGTCSHAPAPNRIYLHTGPPRPVIGLGPPPGPAPLCEAAPLPGSRGAYVYRPAIWHLAVDAGQPALCREVLAGTRMARSCVVQGIEDLQFELGIDRSNDGVADRFSSIAAPLDPAVRRRIVAVRIHLLARSATSGACQQARSFHLGNVVRQPEPDGHCRRSLTMTVVLRNAGRAAGA